ncbi:sll0787 family AIR synthase-like protein [Leptolyngbya ohadii]|uniref:sll0787 family AIR synthase-like protein n=1 Tax=Leptolyngbya ohadii TaxID=1962290 RepID=UPI000B5A073A|nr:sll0787 family AIR synthase-like protein [Leptolyngbya ohadii]
MLADLVKTLQQAIGILHKQDIQTAAQALRFDGKSGIDGDKWADPNVRLGDDCAAIPDGEDYLLLAAEGMMPFFVENDPWFAGWSAVMVNVSDIYAMGGRPIAVVDTLWSSLPDHSKELWAGMRAAAAAYQVPIVGGHTNCHSPYGALSVAILGRAKRLITSFDAQPGDRLLMVVNLEGGEMHPRYPFWNAATRTNSDKLRGDLAILPELAESQLCTAGKDISMGGVIGTTLMLLETSRCGAVIDLDRIPCPSNVPLEAWLTAFPSYGFLLSVAPDCVASVRGRFHDRQIVCEAIGEVNDSSKLVLRSGQESLVFWDLQQQPLTGFS